MHLERLISVLEVVGRTGEASVSDVCDRVNLPKPTAYRLVHDLVAAGLLEPVAKGRFAIGARLTRITQNDQSDKVMIALIAPTLKQAATAYGATFFLSRLHGRGVEIIHVETPETGVSFLHPGLGNRPLHACSCAKAVAAFSPELLANHDVEGRLKAYTAYTITRIEDLDAEFASIRQRGYAECVEEIEQGMCSVAAPLGFSGQGATMSIGSTGTVRVFSPQLRQEIGARLIELAADLQSKLGWSDKQGLRRSG